MANGHKNTFPVDTASYRYRAIAPKLVFSHLRSGAATKTCKLGAKLKIYDPDLDRRAVSGQQCGGMRSAEEIRAEYPLHWHIWHGELEQLQEAIDQVRVDGWLGWGVGWGGVLALKKGAN